MWVALLHTTGSYAKQPLIVDSSLAFTRFWKYLKAEQALRVYMK